MNEKDVFNDFQTRVNNFVDECLSGYNLDKHAKEKSIRDAIWGTSRFSEFEMVILDSPLLQRLRDIKQTGLANLIYPTSVHTRFDHTLGVVSVASKIVRSINDKYPLRMDAKINYNDHMRIRLSAILHDVGHSCLSHISESVYGESEEFKALNRYINQNFGVIPKPHEIMSWLIVRCDRFKRFIEELIEKEILTGWDCSPEDVEAIAGNIIGYRKNPKEKFLADIINGPMDADKLDYLVRDAYFAGPNVVYDLERFLHTVDIFEYPRSKLITGNYAKGFRLSVPIEGVTALEQIIISKLMLYSYLYHHKTIRCVEDMYHEALKRLIQLSEKKTKNFPQLNHSVCFLNLSDRSLLPDAWPPEIAGDPILSEILTMLARRELYKRALIISRIFTLNIDTDKEVISGFDKLLRCGTDSSKRDSLRQQLFNSALGIMKSGAYKHRTKELQKKFKIHHLIVDIPQSPNIEETLGVMIPVSSRASNPDIDEYIPLIDIIPIERWVDAYNVIKWRGHIFTIEEAALFVNAAARKILSEPPYNLAFTKQATDLCKITPLPSDNSIELPLA